MLNRNIKDYVLKLYEQDIEKLNNFLSDPSYEDSVSKQEWDSINQKYTILDDPAIDDEILEIVRVGLAYEFTHDSENSIPSEFKDIILDVEKQKINYDLLEKYLIWKLCIVSFNRIFYIYQNGMFIEDKGEISNLLKKTLYRFGITADRRIKSIEQEIKWRLEATTAFRELPFNKLGAKFLPVKNGVIWRKRENILLPPSPAFGYTYRLNVSYNPEAKCPKIDKFISEIVEEPKILYEVVASCLLQSPEYHFAYMLVGDGSNGKSTFLKVLTAFLGKENVANVSLQDLCNDRFKSSELIGKLANIYADIPKYPIKDVGKFKIMTGGDEFLVEKKFKDPFKIVNQARLIFSANELPEVNDTTFAFWRRWIVIEFPHKFPSNPNLLNELTTEEELSGLLNYSLLYLTKIEENGVTKTETIDKAMQNWMARANNIYAFVSEKLERDLESYVEKNKLYTIYKQFCEERDFTPKPNNIFAKELKRFAPVEERKINIQGSRVRVWWGIKLKDVKPEEIDLEPENSTYEMDLTEFGGLV